MGGRQAARRRRPPDGAPPRGLPASRRRRTRRAPRASRSSAFSPRAATRPSTGSTRRGPTPIVELGATRDDAAGEAFDKVAKLLGPRLPGRPGDRPPRAVGRRVARSSCSAPMAARGSLADELLGDQDAGGAARRARGPRRGATSPTSAPRSRRAVTASLARKVVDAAVREEVRDVVLGGGVAANRELRRRDDRARRAHAAFASSSRRWRAAPTTPR